MGFFGDPVPGWEEDVAMIAVASLPISVFVASTMERLTVESSGVK